MELFKSSLISDCISATSLSYERCKANAERSLEITMKQIKFKCDKSTKYLCEIANKDELNIGQVIN